IKFHSPESWASSQPNFFPAVVNLGSSFNQVLWEGKVEAPYSSVEYCSFLFKTGTEKDIPPSDSIVLAEVNGSRSWALSNWGANYAQFDLPSGDCLVVPDETEVELELRMGNPS